MLSYNSAYPLFDDDLKQIQKIILRSLLYEKHPQHTIVFFNKLIEMIKASRGRLIQHPSLSATNLSYGVNEVYKQDKSVDLIKVKILLCENPRNDRCSLLHYPLYITKKHN
ncbi:hypothetical protein [Planktosalinus lacus]|uniref:Uncharacterized protein n=1 Tax=Planktosalinus lacus TaxID=1526573 RepID=A0A8J2VBE4_9FLAO|nr:hypothetical protein [Planktosalinus lacus]GGD98983.1 hypothetical protein GCM10011312_23080 [Planktosalinus lacus]